jgi:hypothetical protein
MSCAVTGASKKRLIYYTKCAQLFQLNFLHPCSAVNFPVSSFFQHSSSDKKRKEEGRKKTQLEKSWVLHSEALIFRSQPNI